jgi:hypothetical protein
MSRGRRSLAIAAVCESSTWTRSRPRVALPGGSPADRPVLGGPVVVHAAAARSTATAAVISNHEH